MFLCLVWLCAGCNNVKTLLPSPEDYVRQHYGIPYQTEEEYEAACAPQRQIDASTPFGELQAWIAAYCAEDAFFAQKEAYYRDLYNDIEELALGVMLGRGEDEEAFKSLLSEAGYGNEAQCGALIEGLKKDGFLVQELAQMRQAHRVRLMAEITQLCESMGEVDIAYRVNNTSPWTKGEDATDAVSRVYVVAEPSGAVTAPGECPYFFWLYVDLDEKAGTFGSVRIGEKTLSLGSKGENRRGSLVGMDVLPLLNSGEYLVVNCHKY